MNRINILPIGAKIENISEIYELFAIMFYNTLNLQKINKQNMIANSITDLIGKTPLLRLNKFSQLHKIEVNILAKLEAFNPGGSVKDRIALSMIKDAEERGLLKKGYEIIEPTSGNTGIGLAMIAAVRGYKLTLVMPETMSIERRNLLKAYGANLILTPGNEGMRGAIEKSIELHLQNTNSFIPQQFENRANKSIHFETTGQEIWDDTHGEIDIFVAGVGTGGTISGSAKKLKTLKSSIYVVAVEPEESPVISGGTPGLHKLQGIGAGFIPSNFDANVVDKVMKVGYDDAILTSRQLAQEEGLLVGISSGAATYAALKLAQEPENRGKNIVTILPDTGERYLSTELYNFENYPL